MALSVDGRTPSILQQNHTAKDSLKFADIERTFSVISEVPSTDAIAADDDVQYDAQISETLNTMKALQIARKSLSDVQSIAKDIKSSYKTEKNDAYAPLDDSMLRQRYEATKQINNILQNATLNHKNVFTFDYAKEGVTLDLSRKSMSDLNLRDELSINIFSDNIERLSRQIEDNIQKLQGKIDKINQSRWLSMENLRNVRLEQKEVNAALKSANQTPSLATALAQIAQQSETPANSPAPASLMGDSATPVGALENAQGVANIPNTNGDSATEASESDVKKEAAQGSTDSQEVAAGNVPQDIEAILEYKSEPPTATPDSEQSTGGEAQEEGAQANTTSNTANPSATSSANSEENVASNENATSNSDENATSDSDNSATTQVGSATSEATQENSADTTAENVNANNDSQANS